MKTGGSNYITINGSMECPAIGTYHLYPEIMSSNLEEMYEHGQRKVALMLWFAPLNFPAAHDNLWHHVVNGYGGVLCQQHQDNIVAILGLLNQIGFTSLHFRFAPQGNAMDSQWETWRAPQFNENWQFIDSVRNLIDANKGNLSVVFDLGVEHANERLNTSPTHALYCRRMWKLYTDAHGSSDSCGFSVLHGAGGLDPMLRTFRLAKLPFPACYCFDTYGYEYETLTSAALLIPQGSPVYIQETYYNDATSYSDIKRAVLDTGLNFQGIFQWQAVREGNDYFHNAAKLFSDCNPKKLNKVTFFNVRDFPDIYPRRFDNYLVEVS